MSGAAQFSILYYLLTFSLFEVVRACFRHIIEFMSYLSFERVGAWAYMAGLVSSAGAMAGFFYIRRQFVILRPDQMLNMVLKRYVGDNFERCVPQSPPQIFVEGGSYFAVGSCVIRALCRVSGDATIKKIYGPDVTACRFQAFAFSSVDASRYTYAYKRSATS